MRALVGLLTVVLSLLSFFPTAHADVIDPGNPYRRPHRPDLEYPATQVYRLREPDFTLTQVEGKDRTYLLKVTLPGPCQWGFRVACGRRRNHGHENAGESRMVSRS